MLKKIFAMFARMDQSPVATESEAERKIRVDNENAKERGEQARAVITERKLKEMEEETIEVPVEEDKAA